MTNDLEKMLSVAIEAHRNNDLDKAESAYKKILEISPTHSDAHHNLGVLLTSLGRANSAKKSFFRALTFKPTVVQFWKSYLDSLRTLSDVDALKSLESRLTQKELSKTDQAEVKLRLDEALRSAVEAKLLQLSRDLYNSGKFQELLAVTKKNTARRQFNAEIFNLRGASFIELKNYNKAIGEFINALKIEPHVPEFYFNVGNAYRELGKVDVAIEYYEKSLGLNQEYVAAMQNLGIVYTDIEKYDLANEIFKKALNISPDNSGILNALGNVYQKQKNFKQAIKTYLKALKLDRAKPDFHLNLSIALQGSGKDFMAAQIYRRCIKLHPNYIPCLNNYAYLCHRSGEDKRAIEYYLRSLHAEHTQFDAWNSIYFPLRTEKIRNGIRDSEIEKILGKRLKEKNPTEYYLLLHRLSEGSSPQFTSFLKLKKDIFFSKKFKLANNNKRRKIRIDLNSEKKITALLHFGRSGSGLLHSLIDGHPQIQTLPSVYFSEFFDSFTWQEVTSDGFEHLAAKFVDMYQILFDSRSKIPAFARVMTQHKNFGEKEGLTKLGENADDHLVVNQKQFKVVLQRLLDGASEVTPRYLFQAVHAAFADVTGSLNFERQIFYHIHNPSPFALANYVSHFPNGKFVIIVREPMQSCDSWVVKGSDSREKIIYRIIKMLDDLDNYIYLLSPSVGVRLEDVKCNPRKTLSSLCNWMEIDFCEETMFAMTMMGKKWWGDPGSPDYRHDGMNPFGKESINRAASGFFNEHDTKVLETLFYPFSVRFGYREWNDVWFREALEYCDDNIYRLFNFEKQFAMEKGIKEKRIKSDGFYKYFRANLKHRLSQLRQNKEYVGLISPL